MAQEVETHDSFHYESAEEAESGIRCHGPQEREAIVIPWGNFICFLPRDKNVRGLYSLLFLQDTAKEVVAEMEGSSIQLNFMRSPHLKIHIVISTRSGTGLAKSYYQNVLQPLLSNIGLDDYEVHETQTERTIEELCQSKFVASAEEGLPQTIIFLSGDGGVVDTIDTFYKTTSKLLNPPIIGIIPMGTGNAMASSMGLLGDPAAGLKSLLWGVSHPLPIFTATFSPGAQYVTNEGRERAPIRKRSSQELRPQKVHGGVVASWGMHASLIANSDTAEYRTYGAERFKMAAKELLYPLDSTGPHRYAGTITLTTWNEHTQNQNVMTLSNKSHMYALATMVSSLEKDFLISPKSLPLDGRLRFIHFGPTTPEIAMKLMSYAYQGGRHVYEEGVSYMEIQKLRIDFHEAEEKWRRVCVDGKIVAVESDGWLEVCKEQKCLLNILIPTDLQLLRS